MRNSLLLLLVCISFASSADLWWNTKKGTKLYKKGKYDKAQQQFDLAAAANPASTEGQFNRALNLARTGKIGEAKQILGTLKFDNPAKAAELAFTSAKVSEYEGDAAVQKQDIGTAKRAYTEALQQNVNALRGNPLHKGALKNAEITGRKLAQLPDQKDDQNKDKNKDQNKDQQNKDQKKDQNKDDQKKDDQDNKDDQKKDDQDKDQDKKDDQKKDKDQPKPEQPKEDPAQANAAQLLDKYGDDGKDLNKPPVGKAKKVNGGKDW